MKCANCYDSVASMLADKLKVIETMTDEIQTLRAKVESLERLAEISRDLLEVLRGVELEGVILPMRYSLLEWIKNNLQESLATYDKLSEDNIMEKSLSLAKSQLNNYKKLSEVKHDTK